MHPIINSLSLIADAAEYFDRSTSAAWKIRSALTNAIVWQANGLLYAQRTGGERLAISQIKMATMRCWMRDCNASSFMLDLTQPAIRKTLGLERPQNPHEEACRIARGKCLKSLSAARFKEYYDLALAALDEQRKQREEAVSQIEDIIHGVGFRMDGEVPDTRGFPTIYDDEFIADEQLYDNDAVTDVIDRLSETIGNALESMFRECDAQLAAAITTTKIARLSGYKASILNMMDVVGVDTVKIAQRQKALTEQINAQQAVMNGKAEALEAQITDELASMVENTQPPAAPAPSHKLSLSAAGRLAEANAVARARNAEDALKAKRSASARKAAETRRANREAAMA